MRKLLHRDLVGIASSITLSQFGTGLIAVFLPFLLLQKGLALWQICAIYAAYSVTKLVLNYLAMLTVARRGVRLGLTIGYCANAAYLIALTLFLGGWGEGFIYALPLLLGANHAFVWGAQHLHISHTMDETRTGRDLAVITALWRLAGIIAPLLGGAVAIWLGQAWLAAVAAAVVMLAIIPVRRAAALQETEQRIVRYSLRGARPGDLVANFSLCFQGSVGSIVWPIYLAVVIPNVQSIAAVATGSAALAFVLLFVAGKRGDRGHNHRMLIESSVLASTAHVGRLLAVTPFGMTLVSALYQVGQGYQEVPWSSLYYKHARARGINYIMSMEIACDLAFVSLWSLLGLIAYVTADNTLFTVAFVIAALLTWGCLGMQTDKQHPDSPQ
jgi:MFS family permease